MKITLREALDFNRTDAIDAAGDDFEELEIRDIPGGTILLKINDHPFHGIEIAKTI